jgi:hypothetical protein
MIRNHNKYDCIGNTFPFYYFYQDFYCILSLSNVFLIPIIFYLIAWLPRINMNESISLEFFFSKREVIFRLVYLVCYFSSELF